MFSFFCSEEQIRKKASVLFGIKFDGTNYSTLEDHLRTIKSNKDLVHKCSVSWLRFYQAITQSMKKKIYAVFALWI